MKAKTLMGLMKQHFETDEGKELCKKVGLVYQINIAPKVRFLFDERVDFFSPRLLCLDFLGFLFSLFLDLQKIGFDEVSYTVDLKKGVVTEGQSPVFVF